jgi:hypothetical protein
MVGREVLHEYEGHSALRRHGSEQLGDCFQATR